ncbi:MAG: hypothetical protein AB8G95_09600 [Anaerolineae bacterium]
MKTKLFLYLSLFAILGFFILANQPVQAAGGWISHNGATPRRVDRVCRDGLEISAYVSPFVANQGTVAMRPAKLFKHSPVNEDWFGANDTILPEGLFPEPYPFELRREYLPTIGNAILFDIPNVAQPEPITVNGTDYYTHTQKIFPFFIDLEVGDQVGLGNNGINDIQAVQDCWLFDYSANQSVDVPETVFAPSIPWLNGDDTLFTILSLPNSGAVLLNGADPLAVDDQFSLAEIQPVGGYLAYSAESKTDEDQFLTFSVSGTTRISVKTDGSQITGGDSFEPAISANGGRVAFTSNANSIDTNFIDLGLDRDIFLRTSNTETALISRNEGGNGGGNADSDSPSISADGSTVAFVSEASNLVGEGDGCDEKETDTDRREDVFSWAGNTNNLDNQINWVSMFNFNNAGISCYQISEHSTAPAISGSTQSVPASIVFQTAENFPNLVYSSDNNLSDLLLLGADDFIRSLYIAKGTFMLEAPNGRTFSADISADGQTIAFTTSASNMFSDDNNAFIDVGIRELSGTVSRISVTSDGSETVNGDSQHPAISRFGQHIAFESNATNLHKQTNGHVQIYVRDREAECTTLLSINSDGQIGSSSSQDASISANGQFVAFKSSASNLVDGDTNRATDIFVVDRDADNDQSFYSDPDNCVAGRSKIFRISIASDGTQGNGDSFDPDISDDGAFVAFASEATNLVADDTNNRTDVFVHYIGFEGKIRFKASMANSIYLPFIGR